MELANLWVYLNKDRLGRYNRFIIEPVKVLFTEYRGTPRTDEQRHKISEYVRNATINALQDRYPVVTAPSTDTAEIRIAVTDAFRQGGQFGLTIEAEIIDSYTAVQVGGVMRTALGQPYFGLVVGFGKREGDRRRSGETPAAGHRRLTEVGSGPISVSAPAHAGP